MSDDKIDVKYKRVTKGTKEEVEIITENGEKKKATLESFTEAEMEDINLIKIAPMYYFSVESNKVLMIPFSLKMSVEEFIRQTAAQAVNFQNVIARVNEMAKVQIKAKKRLAKKGKQ